MLGKGGGSDVRETRSVSEPPAFLQPFLQTGIQDLTNLYQSGGAADYYPGQTFAPMSGQTRGAIDMITGRASAGSPVMGAAQGMATDVLGGAYLDPNSNPNFKAALDAGFAPQTENFMNKVLPGITSAFEGSGRTGSDMHRFMVQDAAMGLNRAQGEAAAKAGAAHYGSERDRMMAMAGMAPQLANADYLDAMMLAQAGGAAEGWRQRAIDEDVARYHYEQNKDWDYINRYLASLGAGYPGGTTTGSTTGGGSDGFSSALGGLSSLASLGMMGFSLFGGSDRRTKTDVRRIGESDTGLPIYVYRHHGMPEGTEKLGFMADEVAEVAPDAVTTLPGGLQMVDYSAATRGLF